jgi:urea transport system permease protein
MKAIVWFGMCCLYGLSFSVAHALTSQQVHDIVSGDTDTRIESLQKTLAQADAQTAVFLQALADDAVLVAGQQVLIVRDNKATDAVTNQETALPTGAENVVSNNRMRGEIDSALAALQLLSPDDALRMKAAQALLSEPDPSKKILLEKAIAAEKNPAVSQLLLLAQAAIDITNNDAKVRLAAAKALGNSKTPNTQLLLNQQMTQETDAAVKAQMLASLADIKSALAWGERLGALFTGLSLGSILLLVALGLAITYGLMGVINMAHGELMMVGAYATYVVQAFFRKHMGGAFDYYLVAALPVAFLSAALVGALVERAVLRHL